MNDKSRDVLALDFDGVLWNSIRECYEVAVEAWNDLDQPAFRTSYERFCQGRWLVRAGRDFGTLMRLLEDRPELNIQEFTAEEFATLGAQQGEWLERFGERFGSLRRAYRLEREAYWRSLQEPFAHVIEALPILRKRFQDVVVCTTKDAPSSRALLEQVQLDLPVYGLEVGTDKSKHMQLLIDKYHIEPQQVHFIDDLVINLQAAAKAGIRGYLATWGYNTPACRRRAVELGFTPLDKDELIHLGE